VYWFHYDEQCSETINNHKTLALVQIRQHNKFNAYARLTFDCDEASGSGLWPDVVPVLGWLHL
jgi:hypothetical protein